MKIKINWGTAIVIAMALFMIFILQYVYKTIAMDKYDHHLVSEDYYKDELHIQNEIDLIKKANELPQNLKLETTKDGFLFIFPDNMDYKNISAKAYFQRPSDERLDFNQEFVIDSSKVLVKSDNLLKGKWNVKVYWKYNNEEYILKEGLFY